MQDASRRKPYELDTGFRRAIPRGNVLSLCSLTRRGFETSDGGVVER